MIAKLKQFIQSHTQASSPEEKAQNLNLAAATLLLEVVYADEKLAEAEAALLPEMLINTLGITPEQAKSLIAEAKQARHDATSLFEFTAEVNAQFSLEDKQQLLLSMWRLAYADGELSRFEDQIIRRTADLLYLKHSELIQMRNIAIQHSSQ
ncbi:TerB family tellurite resistance protein [Shewanella inventionis]|uniref:Tellurium resistance terB-like protein subgroup 2 n=1 Tax=Shewanella inventionis TaxID=1738770 RepID=A0ABQ1IP09_9GAMM|nr:TerB family tellurite resistance protein [Shewanella inventionis]MCL1156377.1 TerB family tellurite resistance protein [Shewanella inventionis]UAL43403.1 TerB family tellurite resistance protein [Shewanella inventionis]GGB45059.1 tellurium resistance terB-like protein subgroup 2 [Shewanella inventionis]